MEYLVTMTTRVPEGSERRRPGRPRPRAARSGELAAQGHLLRLWRPPLHPGEWRTLGLFAADDDQQLEEVLASMPLRVWRTDEVTPLSPHPNDPAGQTSRPARREGHGEPDHKVAVVTGGSRASARAWSPAYRRRGWAVVATARTIKPAGDPDVLTVEGDIADPATADRIIGAALSASAASTPSSTTPASSSPSRSPTTPPRTTRWSSASTSPASSGHPARHRRDGQAGRRPRRQHHRPPWPSTPTPARRRCWPR